MILYPTETIYALGVNTLSAAELKQLFALKQRPESETVSWLVRDLEDISRHAVVNERAAALAAKWLPGPLTLVLPARGEVERQFTRSDGTIAFRISSDPVAQKLIADFMAEHDAPLTCTSANLSGYETLSTPADILKQFGDAAGIIDTVLDAGRRSGSPSTIVRVRGDREEVLREGSIKASVILKD